MMDVTRILDRVQEGEPRAAEELLPLVYQELRLRCFVGMTLTEVAEALQIGVRTADRHWSFARAWLKRAICGDMGRNINAHEGER